MCSIPETDDSLPGRVVGKLLLIVQTVVIIKANLIQKVKMTCSSTV